MWLFTTDGFYSAVEHRDDPALVMVRCRDEQDAYNLRDAVAEYTRSVTAVQSTPHADYAYRVVMPKTAWANYCMDAALDVDYDNFKNAVAREQGQERAHLYHGVWAVLLRLQGEYLAPFDPTEFLPDEDDRAEAALLVDGPADWPYLYDVEGRP